MIAADTNVLVRLIARDDPAQAALAETLFVEGELFLSHSVLMEVEWVLRGAFLWSRARVSDALLALVRLAGLTVERAADARWALDRHRAGADLADVLHLLAARGAEAFATLDADLGKEAGEAPPVPVRLLG